MKTNDDWLEPGFISDTPIWFIFNKEQYDKGDRANAMLPWTADNLLGIFQPICLNQQVADELIKKRGLTGLVAQEVRDRKELVGILQSLVLMRARNAAVYFGTGNVRFFQTIHLLECLDPV